MKPKLANILIVITVAFLIFSVTLGLLLSYVNFNPMYYEIKTDNISCDLKNWNITNSKNKKDLIRKENSLLNGQIFQQLKQAQQRRQNNLIIRNLTKFDVKFLKNCEDILFTNASVASNKQFEQNQNNAVTFEDFADLQKKLNDTDLERKQPLPALKIKVDINWDNLLTELPDDRKLIVQKELLKFYNIIDYLYRKKDQKSEINILKFLFTIIRVNNFADNVVAVTVSNIAEIWQYMILSNKFSNYNAIKIGYESGFWSTGNAATVIVHEYGHALENFLNSILTLRPIFNSNKFPCEDKILNEAEISWQEYQKVCTTTNKVFLNNRQDQFMDNRIQTASDWLVEWLAKQIGVTEIMQKRLFAWSVVRSNYARTSSFRELFAEAFAQWLLTKEDERTVMWELLNKFFTEKLPQFDPVSENE